MRRKRIKGSVWRPVFMALCACLLADMACGNTGGINQPQAAENDLLQFRAGSHIMGFKPDKVYLVNTSGFISVEFLGSHDVSPVGTAAESNKAKDDPALLQNRKNTLAGLQRVEYQDLWDGITLRYDAVREGIAESTYFIQPGADVADIRLHYNAETQLQKDGSLKITLSTRQGYITESRPVAWQVVDGQKKEVQVAYEIQDGTIGFKTGQYDKDHELIIDPTYQWHTFFGSTLEDESNAIAVDRSGNIYVTGRSASSWLGPGNTPPLHPHQGSIDIMVMKLDRSGAYQWHTFYGSITGLDSANGLAIDGNGSVYVTGISGGTWQGPGNIQPVNPFAGSPGFYDIVILKLDGSGAYQWHTFHGSTNHDYGNAIAVDGNGSSYVTGYSHATWSVFIPPFSFRLPKHAHSGGRDIVAIKLNSSGKSVWHTFYGSADNDQGEDIALDQSGNLFIAGWSATFWLGPDNDEPKYAYTGGTDIIGLKLTGTGEYIGHSFFGSAANDFCTGIVIGASGNIYMAGYSDGNWGSPVHPFTPGLSDIVILGLDPSGTLMWNTFHGSADDDLGYDIAIDRNENIYITSTSYAAWGNPASSYNGLFDIVTCKFSPSGKLLWHGFHGSADEEYGNGIAIGGNGSILVAGSGLASWAARSSRIPEVMTYSSCNSDNSHGLCSCRR